MIDFLAEAVKDKIIFWFPYYITNSLKHNCRVLVLMTELL